MRIAVLGATGVAGRHVVAEARRRGAEVVAASRASGVDVTSGAGLDAALEGVTAVVDALNVPTLRRREATAFFATAARNVQAAARRAGVAHVVVLSIVGLERARALGYYGAKLAHERHHLDGPVAASVLRATQFHEFAAQSLARGAVGPVAVVPRLRVQTVAVRSVAAALVELALDGPRTEPPRDVAGPGPEALLSDLAREVARRRGTPRVVAVGVPGAGGRAVRDGALLPGPDARLLGPGFDEWLEGPDAPSG